MATIITPEVGKMHWDDLLHEFEVCASLELDTPFGIKPNFRECINAADLASAVAFIIKLWTQVGTDPATLKLAFPMGDKADLDAAWTRALTIAAIVPTLPSPPSPNAGPEDGLDPDPTDFGITAP